MCGRFTLSTDVAYLEKRFTCRLEALTYTPSYNIAPSQSVVAVIHDGENRAGLLRWGLVPSWAKDPKSGYKLTNVRAETVGEKPSFRQALRKRRCLILADGFYEWHRTPNTKIPMYVRLASREPFAFAGLWEKWRDPDTGEALATCAILTTSANALMQLIHHRMPVILEPDAESLWLDRTLTDEAKLLPLLTVHAPDDMEAYEVSAMVNTARNNTSECLAPVEG